MLIDYVTTYKKSHVLFGFTSTYKLSIIIKTCLGWFLIVGLIHNYIWYTLIILICQINTRFVVTDYQVLFFFFQGDVLNTSLCTLKHFLKKNKYIGSFALADFP